MKKKIKEWNNVTNEIEGAKTKYKRNWNEDRMKKRQMNEIKIWKMQKKAWERIRNEIERNMEGKEKSKIY